MVEPIPMIKISLLPWLSPLQRLIKLSLALSHHPYIPLFSEHDFTHLDLPPALGTEKEWIFSMAQQIWILILSFITIVISQLTWIVCGKFSTFIYSCNKYLFNRLLYTEPLVSYWTSNEEQMGQMTAFMNITDNGQRYIKWSPQIT